MKNATECKKKNVIGFQIDTGLENELNTLTDEMKRTVSAETSKSDVIRLLMREALAARGKAAERRARNQNKRSAL